jgi:hypothetical protein
MSLRSFFTPLLERDPSGRGWLSALLQATPRAADRLGPDLVAQPGSLSMSLSVRGISGAMGAFEYPLSVPRELTAWMIEHPGELQWIDEEGSSPQTIRLRRALVLDEPSGSRARAQERARELSRSRSVLSQEWWRFEDLGTIECLLMTERLVLTVASDERDPKAPVTRWYPQRPNLIRAIEAARELANQRAWACVLLSGAPVQVDDSVLGDRALETAAPHLAPNERFGLRDAYLGNLTWEQAAAAVAALDA